MEGLLKLVAETNEHTPNVDGEPFLSDVEQNEAILEDASKELY